MSSRWACVQSQWPTCPPAGNHEDTPPILSASPSYLYVYAERGSSLLELRQWAEIHDLGQEPSFTLLFHSAFMTASINHSKGTQTHGDTHTSFRKKQHSPWEGTILNPSNRETAEEEPLEPAKGGGTIRNSSHGTPCWRNCFKKESRC